MSTLTFRRPWTLNCLLALTVGMAAAPQVSFGQSAVPGVGREVIGDDFEDPDWTWIANEPKSSSNIDNQTRYPLGTSANGAWVESPLRGQPDSIRRVPTPPGGLPGSQGALAIRSIHSGVPGRLTNKMQQDDLIMHGRTRLGYALGVQSTPSTVVRVWLPPFEQWERRTGSHFGFRADCLTTKQTVKRGFLASRTVSESESYWPGMFIQFHSKSDGRREDSAVILVRSGPDGHEIMGPPILETGWWTLGMSFTPDGRVHYYARAGVEDLTADDLITSQWPYGYRCEQVNTIFFNIVNQDDGRTWSTEFIIDDPKMYVLQ